MKPSEAFPFADITRQRAFGAPGAGGAMGYGDPDTGIGYSYVTNRMGSTCKAIPATSRCVRRSPTAPRCDAEHRAHGIDLSCSRLRHRSRSRAQHTRR